MKKEKQEIIKADARLIGGDDVATATILSMIEPSQAQNERWDNQRNAFDLAGAIEPIYDKDMLCRTVAKSGPIQENIGVYECAIEGFGHDLIPALDPDSDGAREQVKYSMWARLIDQRDRAFEKAVAAAIEEAQKDPRLDPDKVDEAKILATFQTDKELEPSDETVDAEVEELKREIEFQKIKAQRFFKNAARVGDKAVGFVALRKVLRRDLETTGEFYAEVLRDERGRLSRLSHVKSLSVRRMPLTSNQRIPVLVPERIDPFTIAYVQEYRAFRVYVQVDPETMATRFFKQMGDPRVISPLTGRAYNNNKELQEAEGDPLDPTKEPIPEANELLSSDIYDPESVYGTPRWICLTPEVTGHRKASEVNFLYFDNKGIPPFLVTVSGGQLSRECEKRVGEHLKQLKGSDNFHKILVLEAAPFGSNIPGMAPQKVMIQVEPLIKFLPEDALFQGYQDNNEVRVAAQYRTPPMLRGRAQDYTRATSREATKFFEQFVATPERQRFDDLINYEIFPDLGITLIQFKSRGPDTTDPEVFEKVLDTMAKHGGLVPRDVRQEAERFLGRELGKFGQPWAEIPLQMSTVGISSGTIAPPGMDDSLLSDKVLASAAPAIPANPQPPTETKTEKAARIDKVRALIRKTVQADLERGGHIWIGNNGTI